MRATSLIMLAVLLLGAPAAVWAGDQTQDVTVTFREWKLPTPGSHPHDPLAAADGSIWYSGQMASVLGRIDPQAGRIAEYHTKTPGSGPHGLVADREGNIWFTANFKGYIGKLDPRSGGVTEYR
ncbi:MAG: hypothetical protein JO122_12920, partial [Acetobacteraceae bacterium]|nr:hypothetical protein [Acetobacteraceae bacterium]